MFELFFFNFMHYFNNTFWFFSCKYSNNLISLSNQLLWYYNNLIYIAINKFFFSIKYINKYHINLPVFIIAKNLNHYLSYTFLRFLILNAIIVFLLLAKSNIYRPDAILYHLPHWHIKFRKIIFGLSNLLQI